MSEYDGKYRARLRLIDVPRVEDGDNEKETEYFYFEEDEEIIDVAWFSGSVSVTLAKIEWRNKFKFNQSPESTQGKRA